MTHFCVVRNNRVVGTIDINIYGFSVIEGKELKEAVRSYYSRSDALREVSEKVSVCFERPAVHLEYAKMDVRAELMAIGPYSLSEEGTVRCSNLSAKVAH